MLLNNETLPYQTVAWQCNAMLLLQSKGEAVVAKGVVASDVKTVDKVDNQVNSMDSKVFSSVDIMDKTM